MAQKFPENLVHYNPDQPLIDDNQLGGGAVVVANLAARNSFPQAKRKVLQIMSWNEGGANTSKRFEGANTSDTEWQNDANWQPLASAALDNVIIVSKVGGDFQSVKDALDSITDNSETKRYTVLVTPGIYTENNPIQGKEYVSVVSDGGNNTVRIVAANTGQHLFLGANLFYLIGLSLYGVAGATSYAVWHDVLGEFLIDSCVLTDCSNGIYIDNANASANILNLAIYNPAGGTTGFGVNCQAGNILIDLCKVVGTSGISTVINADGGTTLVTVNKLVSFSTNVTTAIYARNGARVSGLGNRVVGAVDGIVITDSNTLVKLDANQFFNIQQDGVRIENVGTGIELALFATTISGSGRYNANILNANSITTGSGFSETDLFNFVTGAKFYAYVLDTKEDDEGLKIIGELSVGSPVSGFETVMGEGDSYTTGMLVYTETSAGVFTDVSTLARSASGSTFTFPNVTANNAIYMASNLLGADYLQHYGLKTKVATAATVGAGEIVLEYWNGAAWVEFNAMETDSGNRYFPHAKNYFQDSGSHQVRYDIELTNNGWAKNDPMGIGTAYFWARFRIATAITVAPVLEQFKLHTSRKEINADGFVEYFGNSRPTKQLALNLTEGVPFEGAMQNEALYVSENVGLGGNNNKFTATGDKLGIAGFLPNDLDTSCPVKLQWTGRANASETITWTVRWAWVTEGDPLTTAEPGIITKSGSTTVSKALTANQNSVIEAIIDVSQMVASRDGAFGDQLWISIQPSTMGSTFTLAASQATYTAWNSGGHI